MEITYPLQSEVLILKVGGTQERAIWPVLLNAVTTMRKCRWMENMILISYVFYTSASRLLVSLFLIGMKCERVIGQIQPQRTDSKLKAKHPDS